MSSQQLLAATAVAVGLVSAASVDAGTTAKHYHIFRATSFESLAKQAPPPAGDMNYYGGKVFSNVVLQSVMWNKDVLQNTQTQIPLFSAAIVDSTYVDQEKEFNTKGQTAINGHRGTKQTINRGTYVGQVVLKPHNTSKSLTDEDVQAELATQIAEGKLAPRNANALYMVYFPSDIHISLGGAQSCVSFGAYHFASNDEKTDKKHNIWYSVEPECNSGFGFLTFAASHEFTEASTDNVPTPGSNPDFPQAWNDAQGFENADKCSTNGTLTSSAGTWTVTQYYLNSKHACSTGNYTSP